MLSSAARVAHARHVHLTRFCGAVAVASSIVAAGCVPTAQNDAVKNASKVLQNVHVEMTPAAQIRAVQGTTISVTSDGESASEQTSYEPAEVVSELPVRVTTQYKTDNGSGSDLAELHGLAGKVDIAITIENLTAQSKYLTYDAGGEQKTAAALVGVPLTIAASTKLTGVKPSDVLTGPTGSASNTLAADASTNGILSADDDGSAVVQWGATLAPPQSGASTTLHLVADVNDFAIPTIDLAIQPRLTSDASAAGAVPRRMSRLMRSRMTRARVWAASSMLGFQGSPRVLVARFCLRSWAGHSPLNSQRPAVTRSFYR